MTETPLLDSAVEHLHQASLRLQEARVSTEIARDRDVQVIIEMAAAARGLGIVVGAVRRETREANDVQ